MFANEYKEALDRLNPIVILVYMVSGMIFTMACERLIYTGLTLLCTGIVYLMIQKDNPLKFIAGISIILLLVLFINPFFDTYGDKVIFKYFSNRAYTQEALLRALNLAVMFCAVLCWFSCFNIIVNKDMMFYMFGRFTPTIALMLSMAFGYISQLKKKNRQIQEARRCIGLIYCGDKKKERLKSDADIFFVMAQNVLENSFCTAQSMKSRGYATEKRTSFGLYIFRKSSMIQIIVIIALIICTVAAPVNIGIAFYAVYLAIPFVLIFKEKFIWHFIKSKI